MSNEPSGRFGGDMDRNEVEIDLSKFMELLQEQSRLKDRIRELEDEGTKNPHQRWIFLAWGNHFFCGFADMITRFFDGHHKIQIILKK